MAAQQAKRAHDLEHCQIAIEDLCKKSGRQAPPDQLWRVADDDEQFLYFKSLSAFCSPEEARSAITPTDVSCNNCGTSGAHRHWVIRLVLAAFPANWVSRQVRFQCQSEYVSVHVPCW